MKSYSVQRLPGEIKLDADAGAAPWRNLKPLKIDFFPWYESGGKQMTTVKACVTPSRLCIQFECEDRHISARCTTLNGLVCRDSCVELFASAPEDPGNYFNLEINCCGTIHLGYGPDRDHRRLASAKLAQRIEVFHSVGGPTKDELPEDDGWVLRVGLPLDALSEFIGASVAAAPGIRWRANFYRCGGVTDPQYACWSPVGTPGPDFHRPEYFGALEFSE